MNIKKLWNDKLQKSWTTVCPFNLKGRRLNLGWRRRERGHSNSYITIMTEKDENGNKSHERSNTASREFWKGDLVTKQLTQWQNLTRRGRQRCPIYSQQSTDNHQEFSRSSTSDKFNHKPGLAVDNRHQLAWPLETGISQIPWQLSGYLAQWMTNSSHFPHILPLSENQEYFPLMCVSSRDQI